MPKDHEHHKVIEFEKVSFSYGEHRVLRGIDLSITHGDFMGLIGPNGGGKTTLIKLALGLLKPDSGDIRLLGEPIEDFRDWHKIGYLAQGARNFDPAYPATVFEVVLMGRIAKAGLGKRLGAKDRRAARKALRQVGMQQLAKRRIGELSGGQQQRTFIARALAAEPEILILDEPTAGIDVSGEQAFYKLLTKLNSEMGITLVLVTHEIGVVSQYVNKITCVSGKLCYHGPASGITVKELEKAYGQDVNYLKHKNH